MTHATKHTGVFIALLLLLGWSAALYWLLAQPLHAGNWWLCAGVLLMTHLYTGLFITAHDAMHGTVSANKTLNKAIGTLCALLFAFNYYPALNRKHHLHHRFVATDQDPDYHHSNRFFRWYFSFVRQYVTLWQLLAMAVTFNLLILVFPEPNVVLFWMLPSILSTLQLFYFGTYLPHRGQHAPDNTHRSRSQTRNHLWAFLSCYFFGYHYEHHASPGTPWWKLPQVKALFDRRNS